MDYNEADWALVVKYLSCRSEFRKEMPWSVESRVWLAADGFGPGLSLAYISTQLEWDWSHIRDSSGAAVTCMANVLRSAGLN